MSNIFSDLITALPEIFVLGMAMFILLLDLFLKPSQRGLIFWLAQLTLVGAAVITIITHTPAVTYAFNGMFVDDPMSDVLKVMTYIGTAMMFVYTRHYLTLRGMFRGEYYALVLFAMVGMMVMI